MKKKTLIALIALVCLLSLGGVAGYSAWSAGTVASVGGAVYSTLQEALDAAARGETEAERVVLLLSDVDLGDGSAIVKAGDVTLNLNGHAITGAMDALIVVRDGARLVIADEAPGFGVIRGADCAIRVEGAGSSLIVEAGTVESLKEGAAVRCAAGSAVEVNGGSVGGIELAEGATVQNGEQQPLVRYDLTIGAPPVANAGVSGLSTKPGLAQAYGPLATNGKGVVHVWLPAGQTWVSAQVGCVVYGGTIRGEHPYEATLARTGVGHDFSGGWRTDGVEHWKVCRNVGCVAEAYLAVHSGGAATCAKAAVCSVCGAFYKEPLGHDFESSFTVDLAPTCTAAGRKSRHCSRCAEVTDITAIPATGHSFPAGWQASAGAHWKVCTNPGCAQEDGRVAHAGKEATCTEAAVCSTCGASYAAALGHDFSATYAVDKAPTCTEAGSKSRHCSRCDEVADVTEILPSGHAFSASFSSDAGGHWHDSTCGHDVTYGFGKHTPAADDGDCTTPTLCTVCGYAVLPASEHAWGDWQASETDHWKLCTVCGTEKERAEHVGGTATCTEDAVCAVCGKAYIAARGHDFEPFLTFDIPPTCTEPGKASYHCKRCDAVTGVTDVIPNGHTFASEWSHDATNHWLASTCGHDVTYGFGKHTAAADDGDCTTPVLCTVCGTVITPAEEAHFWGAVDTTYTGHWFLCTNDDCLARTEFEPHYGGTATCTEEPMCDGCGDYYGEPLGHDFAETFTVDQEATCAKAGLKSRHCKRCDEVTDETAVEALPHPFATDWSYDEEEHWHAGLCDCGVAADAAEHTPEDDDGDCTTPTLCTVCGYVIVPADEHVWGELLMSETEHWAVCTVCEMVGAREAHVGGTATCTEDAVCAVCGKAYIAARGHDFEPFLTFDIPPTCTEPGKASYHCKRCDAVTGVTDVIPNGHTFAPDWSHDATNHWLASTCGHDVTYGFGKHTPAAGYTAAVAPTCTAPGSEALLCTRCGAVLETREILASGHDWGAWTTVTPATATEPGLERRVCRTNLEHFETREIPVDSDWGAWTTVTAPTCAAAGSKQRVCLTDPERTETREIPIDPDAHAWDAGTVTTRATCTAEGVRTFACLNDPAHTRTEPIPISEHTHAVTIINPPGATLEVYAYDASSETVTPIESGMEVSCGTQIIIGARLESTYDWADSGVYVNGSPYDGDLYPVSSDTVITGRTELRTFTVTVTAGTGGTCTPGGEITALYDGELTITIAPDPGYRVKRVIADEADCGPITSYTFYYIRSNTRALFAEFVRAYDITASAGAYGSISSPGTTSVDAGDNMTYTLTPDAGCRVKDVQVDGESVGAVTSYTFTGVAGAHTIHAVFEEEPYTVTASAGANGSVSPEGATTVRAGTDLTYTITPDDGYRIKDVLVDGASVGIRASYMFTNIRQPHTIFAEFEIIPYTIAASAGANGTISPLGTTELAPGSNTMYRIIPNWGYKVADVKVDGMSVGNVTVYAFTGVWASHTIAAEFEPVYHTINALAGSGGSVTPAGPTSVKMGTDMTYTVTPNPGMMILSVIVDGSHAAGPSFTPIPYTFQNVTGAHSIEATYAQKFDVTTSVGVGGRISPSGTVSCQAGKDLTFTITADEGYRVNHVRVDGVSLGPFTASSYTFSRIDRNHTISAVIDKVYDITASAGEHGTISPPGVTTLGSESWSMFRITPDEGYKIKDVLVDGVSVGAVTSVTFDRLEKSHTIHATFWAVYDITASAGANGTISPAGVTTLEAGNDVTYTITPNAGYKVKDVLVDGASVGPVTSYTFHGDFADHTIHATFLKGHYITSSASQFGQISPLGTTAVEVGGSVTYTFTPDADYRLKDVLVDGVSVGKVASYTFKNVQAAHTIEAKFEMDLYVIKASAGPHGTVYPSGDANVLAGANQTYIITPEAGYNIKDVKVDGVSVGKFASYAFTNIRADHTITAEFWMAYDITAYANTGGTISPPGVTTVLPGGDITYTITPDWGMQIAYLLVDETPLSMDAFESITYTFKNVTRNHTIQAVYFSISKVTASAGAHGQIYPSGEMTYASGSSPAYTITPDSGYRIKDVLVDGKSVGPVSPYLFHSVAGSRTIYATFEEDVYTITASAGAGGAISPSGSVQVNRGVVKAFTITPNAGYKVADVTVDGVSVGAVTTYSFLGVTAHHTISATFARLTYQITATAGPGGTVTPSGVTTVNWGEGQQYTITPDAGYRVKDVMVDGASVGAVATYTLSNVTGARTIQATFEQITYTITASAGAGGSISPSGVTTLVFGASRQYTVTPGEGYAIQDVLVDGVSVGRVSSYTFASVSAAHTISASFAVTYPIEAPPSTGGGAVTPAGVTNVPQGSDQAYAITPDVGYYTTRIQVDGVSVTISPSYTFTNVTGPHTIRANFEKVNYTITIPDTVGGRITTQSTAQYGDSIGLDIRADPDYRLKEGSVKVNGASITSKRFIMPAENVTVTAEFERVRFLVTVVTPAHGTVLAPSQSIEPGTAVTLDVRPDAGYRLNADSLKVNGASISGTTFTMPAQNVTVTAKFEQYLFWVMTAPMVHGTLVIPTVPLEAGTVVTLTAIPDDGYRLIEGSIRINGVATPYMSFVMPAQTVGVYAEFEKIAKAFGGEMQSFGAPPEETPGGEAEGPEAPPEETPDGEAEDPEPPAEEPPEGEAENPEPPPEETPGGEAEEA